MANDFYTLFNPVERNLYKKFACGNPNIAAADFNAPVTQFGYKLVRLGFAYTFKNPVHNITYFKLNKKGIAYYCNR
jgi:hypothetical protein